MLKVNDVKKNYEQFTLECSLQIHDGCITGLIGQNGAGKSTLFKAILGLITIDQGNIVFMDKDIKTLKNEDKEKIGVVLSDSGFSGYLTIHDIVSILKNTYTHFEEALFISQCQKFALPFDQKIKEFSNGMKAKLKVLIAMSHHAKLLILDEPTAGLDVIARDEILDLLREYMEEDHRTILMSSHISSDLEGLCDDLYMIDQGHIIAHEDTDVLLSQYAILKMGPKQYSSIDKQYILKTKKESYGYQCLTNQKQFYLDNYKDIVIENGHIDDYIMLMMRGEKE